MIEGIQGESGIRVIPDFYMKDIKKICDEKNILLIADEIQSGLYRTGKYFSYMYSGIKPSLVPFAKAVAGGYPCSGVLFEEKVAKSMTVGTDGNTFSGSPLSMAIANKVLDLMFRTGHIRTRKKSFKCLLSPLCLPISPRGHSI